MIKKEEKKIIYIYFAKDYNKIVAFFIKIKE